jgi:serine 3-dehydrogenase
MPLSMSGQVVLILGASSGIGRGAAVLFAREGARVVAAARREDRLQSLKEQLATEQCDVTIRRADVSSPEEMGQLAQVTLTDFGRIDVLVYASGTNTPDRSMERLTPGIWDSLIDVNLNGAFYATHAVLPAMRRARSGLLIYISSMGGVMPDLSGAAYQASKRGVLGL